MRFREFFNNTGRKSFDSLTKLGAINFGRGITEKSYTRTPHYEMDKCLTIATDNPIVAPAINQLIDYIMPGNKVIIESEDDKTRKFLEKWHELRPDINREYKNILHTNIASGNGALQYIFNKNENLDNIKSVNDTSRLFYNPDYEMEDQKFIYELPLTIRTFKFDGEYKVPEFYKIKYVANNTYIYKMVWGIPVSGKKIKRYLTGWSRDGYYGRSQLASGIDVHNIMFEIMNSWDTISKMKQINQKIITPDTKDGMLDLGNLDADSVAKMLEDATGSYTFLPMPLKLLQQDFKVAKGYDLMEGVFDILRRMMIMNLLPIHLTSWGDSSTTQGSEVSMPPYLARIINKQKEFSEFLTRTVIGKLREKYTWLAEDAKITFPYSNVMGDEYYIKIVTMLKREGIITSEKGAKMLVKMGVIDKDMIEDNDTETKIVSPFGIGDKKSLDIDYDLNSRINTRKKELEKKKYNPSMVDDPEEKVDKAIDDEFKKNNKKLVKDLKK